MGCTPSIVYCCCIACIHPPPPLPADMRMAPVDGVGGLMLENGDGKTRIFAAGMDRSPDEVLVNEPLASLRMAEFLVMKVPGLEYNKRAWEQRVRDLLVSRLGGTTMTLRTFTPESLYSFLDSTILALEISQEGMIWTGNVLLKTCVSKRRVLAARDVEDGTVFELDDAESMQRLQIRLAGGLLSTAHAYTHFELPAIVTDFVVRRLSSVEEGQVSNVGQILRMHTRFTDVVNWNGRHYAIFNDTIHPEWDMSDKAATADQFIARSNARTLEYYYGTPNPFRPTDAPPPTRFSACVAPEEVVARGSVFGCAMSKWHRAYIDLFGSIPLEDEVCFALRDYLRMVSPAVWDVLEPYSNVELLASLAVRFSAMHSIDHESFCKNTADYWCLEDPPTPEAITRSRYFLDINHPLAFAQPFELMINADYGFKDATAASLAGEWRTNVVKTLPYSDVVVASVSF
jgi:hypothetical protein